MNGASHNPDAPYRGLLPSISAMVWVVLFLGLSLTSARTVLISGDSDPAWHRRLGDWMIQHHAIIREYDFLHTYRGPLVTKEWLSEVLFAAAGRVLGWGGIVLIAASLIATCFCLLHRQLLAEGCNTILATGLVLVAMLTCSMHWLARPLLFTHLLTLVFAWQLRWFQHGRVPARRLFILLPLLMVLWVNLHGMFMTGLVLIVMHALGSAIEARRDPAARARSKLLAVLLLICGVATLVNPNGWELHAHILRFVGSREMATLTTENMSPNLHTVGMHGFLLLLLLLASGLIVVRPKLNATDVLLIGGWGYCALLSARNVPIFAIVVTPLLGQWLTDLVRANHGAWWAVFVRGSTAPVTSAERGVDCAVALAAVTCVALLLAWPGITGGASLFPTDFPSPRYPTAAVEYLRAHPETVHGEMFNDFLWGGYFDYALPERKPFIDSRNDSYGLDLVHEFLTANGPRRGWQDVFAKYHVDWTVLPPQHPLNQVLHLCPDWHVVFSNDQALVFSRQS